MTVVGATSLEAERDGYKRERLTALMLAEKRRALVTGGSGAGAQEAPASLTVSELTKYGPRADGSVLGPQVRRKYILGTAQYRRKWRVSENRLTGPLTLRR